MKFTPSSREVTLLLLLAAGVALPQATSWKGMLVARPAMYTLSLEAQSIGLTGFREVRVLVEEVPAKLKDSITRDDIQGWTVNRLNKIGMRVVTREYVTNAYMSADRSTDEKALSAQDRLGATVIVTVTGGRTAEGAIFAFVALECKRSVFISPGYFAPAVVWQRGTNRYFTVSYDAKNKIKGTLDLLLDDLEKDWKKCNP